MKMETQQPNKLKMTGQFHLGLKYDVNIWLNSPACSAFPAQEEKTQDEIDKNAQGGFTTRQKKIYIDM